MSNILSFSMHLYRLDFSNGKSKVTEIVLVLMCILALSTSITGTRTIVGYAGSDVVMNWKIHYSSEDLVSISHNSKNILVIWPHENHSYPETEYKDRLDFSIVRQDQELRLIVYLRNISKQDEGLYTAYRQLHYEEIEAIRLIVDDEITKPVVKETSRQHADNIKTTTELLCQLSKDSNDTVVWWINNSRLIPNEKYVIFNNTLTIFHVAETDQYDRFSCEYDMNFIRSESFRIRLEGPNIVTFTPYETKVNELDDWNISCSAKCSLSCSIQWTKHNDHEIPDMLVFDSAIIHVQNVTREDAGKYSCVVKNTITNKAIIQSVTLEVIYGPDDMYFSNIKRKYSPGVQFKTVICFADCHPSCEYSLIGPGMNIVHSRESLHNVTEKGTYTCRARNPTTGKTSMAFYLTIEYYAVLSPEQEEGTCSFNDHYDSRNNNSMDTKFQDNVYPLADKKVTTIMSSPAGMSQWSDPDIEFISDACRYRLFYAKSTKFLTNILSSTAVIAVIITCLISGFIVYKSRKRCFKSENNTNTITAGEVGPPDIDLGVSRDIEIVDMDIYPTTNYWTIREDITGGLRTVLDENGAFGHPSLGSGSCPIKQNNPQENMEDICLQPDEDTYIHPV